MGIDAGADEGNPGLEDEVARELRHANWNSSRFAHMFVPPALKA